MNNKKGRIATMLFVAICIVGLSFSSYAHSGRTDSSGGHRDNKNKSGLGSYHYHCGGYPAHLHKNGVCPYTSKSTSSSSTKPVSAEPVTVKATKIEIEENIETMYVGDTETLTATISPSNVTNKKITWKTSDKDIVTIDSNGKITAKKVGTAEITASTPNGKTSSIKINVIEEVIEVIEEKTEEIEDNKIIETPIVSENKITNENNENKSIENNEESDATGGVITLGLLGGGYWLYSKNKKSKKQEK